MSFRLIQKDRKILSAIAEYRVLGARQLAGLHGRNVRALRRRLLAFEAEGLIQTTSRSYGDNRGRPEKLLSLSEEGVCLLKSEGILDPDIPNDLVTADRIRCLDHLLLTNLFRFQLNRIPTILPSMSPRFLSPSSPFLHRSSDDQPMIHERIAPDDGLADGIEFTPDGVLSIADPELEKVLLFFLEVDMGTETLASPRRCKQDVRQKVVNYQTYFRLHRYKRYESIWKCRLRGFRLLFLTYGAARMAVLGKLVEAMPPSGFIWLTDRGSLLSEGVWARIWAQGGRLGMPLQSILGSQLPASSPAPFTGT
jgi:hypothetical protein